MAVSAFKSTTKRISGFGGIGNETESASIAPFQPSTPFNKRSHRRTRSYSDFSSLYLSDSASVTGDANSKHLDSLFRQGRLSTRYQSDDSESDADSMYSRHTYRSRQIAELGASRKAALESGKQQSKMDLRRSSSSIEGNYKEIEDFLSCIDDPTEANRVFSRPTTSTSFRRHDAQSDSESVFSRLTRPRQSVELGPPRTGGAAALRNGKVKGTRASALRRSMSQTILCGSSIRSNEEGHSETDSSYSRPNYRSRHNSDFGGSSAVAARNKGTRQGTLRRSLSQIEGSDSVGNFRHQSHHHDDSDSPEEVFYKMELDLPGDDNSSSDHPEEVKTIRAVHTQNKEPGTPELDAISLYDAMRAEMRNAVLEIKREIEQKSVSKEVVLAAPSCPEGLEFYVPGEDDDADSSVSEVRQEYAAKLEQSEKRAQELWTQLAAEESRCLELVKFVKELLPTQPGSGRRPQATPPPQLRPLMGPEEEKQLVSQCLDADAQRYFDECVSISGLEIMSTNDASSCGIGYQNESPAWSMKDMSFSPRKRDFGRANEKKVALLEPLVTFCAQIEQNGRCSGQSSSLFARSTINDDGLVLPWLQWETDLDLSFQQESSEKDASTTGSLTTSTSRSPSKALRRSRSLTRQDSRHQSKDKEEIPLRDFPPGVSGLGCLSNGDLSSWNTIEFGHLKNVGVDSAYDRGRHDGRFDVETFVLQRMWLRHRIKDGRILICGGIRL